MAEAFNIRSDDHIFSIMRAKFTSYSDFHTNMYHTTLSQTSGMAYMIIPSVRYMKQKEYRALHSDQETTRDIVASLIAPTVLSIAAVLMAFVIMGTSLITVFSCHKTCVLPSDRSIVP